MYSLVSISMDEYNVYNLHKYMYMYICLAQTTNITFQSLFLFLSCSTLNPFVTCTILSRYSAHEDFKPCTFRTQFSMLKDFPDLLLLHQQQSCTLDNGAAAIIILRRISSYAILENPVSKSQSPSFEMRMC